MNDVESTHASEESTLPSTSVSRRDFLASRPESSRRAVSLPFLQSNEAAALAYNPAAPGSTLPGVPLPTGLAVCPQIP